jgi:hypothetical protein
MAVARMARGNEKIKAFETILDHGSSTAALEIRFPDAANR